MEKKIRGGALIARALKDKGINKVFTLSGGFCNPAIEGFMECQIDVVNCPHEQIAGHLADGHTRITRKPSVCLVGPEGFANAVPSMMEAWGERTPIIYITGSSSLKRQGSGALKKLMMFQLLLLLQNIVQALQMEQELENLLIKHTELQQMDTLELFI